MAWPVISETKRLCRSHDELAFFNRQRRRSSDSHKVMTMNDNARGKENSRDCDVSRETLLKLSKEITIKFIEVGRVTPSTFPECFTNIYKTLESTAETK